MCNFVQIVGIQVVQCGGSGSVYESRKARMAYLRKNGMYVLHGGLQRIFFKTINVHVVFMARDVMILMLENPISRAIGRCGP